MLELNQNTPLSARIKKCNVKILLMLSLLLLSNFTFSQSSWNQLGADITGSSGDGLGSAIAMSADGKIVAIGPPVPIIQVWYGFMKNQERIGIR